MGNGARAVRHLRLRAPSEAAVRRTARVLEDALRTATLPDAGGPMLFVRRLALGSIPVDAESTSLALALERAVARAGAEYRHGASPDGGRSAAIWFRDPLDAHVCLARRVLAGARPEEWYWPLAVPSWNRGLARAEAVRAIAYSLAERPEATVALPRWFAELVAAGYGDDLSSVLREEDAVPLARAAGVRFDEATRLRRGQGAVDGFEERSGPDGPPSATGVLPRGGSTPPDAAADGNAVQRLILAMLQADHGVGVDRGGGIAAGDASARENILHHHIHRPSMGTSAEGVGATLDAHRRHQRSGVASPKVSGRRATRPSEVDDRLAADLQPPNQTRDGKLDPDAYQEAVQDGSASLPTVAGGLFFLLNALQRVGYGEWLTLQPEWESQHVARRVLAALLGKLEISPDDPTWSTVALPSQPGPPPRRFIAPSRWRQGLLKGKGPLLYANAGDIGRIHDPSGLLLLAGWQGPCPRPVLGDRRLAMKSSKQPGALDEEVVGAWEIALRRWLRRFAAISLADLVLRPALMTATPTHLDIYLDPTSAEPRIRRAGLDFDAGWVSWFRRVVTFHYDRGGLP